MRLWRKFVWWLAADEIRDARLSGKVDGRNEARQMIPLCENCMRLQAEAMRNVYPDGVTRAYYGASNAFGGWSPLSGEWRP